MSGTRSPSRKEPATEPPLVLIAAHGERGGAMANARLKELAQSVACHLDGHDVVCGTLAGSPAIEDALKEADGREVLVFPYFMANGYFVDHALAGRLKKAATNFRMLEPLGTHHGLAEIAAGQIGRLGKDGNVLIVAHGSTKDPRSKRETERFADRLAELSEGRDISCCYLEEEPFADDAVAALGKDAVIVSLFAGDGLHAAGDLPEIMARYGKSGVPVVTPAADIDAVARIIVSALGDHIASSRAA